MSKAPGDWGGGSEIAGNVIAGLGLGWLAQHFFPQVKPWGYALGIILGAVSGIYHVLKREGALKPWQPKDKRGPGDPDQP